MASLDSSLSEADRMAQGACDGSGTTRPDYVSSGDLIGMGPDSAQHMDMVSLQLHWGWGGRFAFGACAQI